MNSHKSSFKNEQLEGGEMVGRKIPDHCKMNFTGANDTGVQLRRRGFPTEVLFCGKPMGADRSIVIDTESRTVHPDHAYEIVSHALEDVDFDSFRYVIKKG